MKPDSALCDDPAGVSFGKPQGVKKYQGILESYEYLDKKGGTHRLKRFFRWAKIVVGSLATIVPGLKELAEILNEYLEAVGMGIEDAEDTD